MATIWIDLENTPHVPFFVPIIKRLEASGHRVILTSRDFAQTADLVDRYALTTEQIGKEYGTETIGKVLGISRRALALRTFVKKQNVDLAVGHGSRGLVIAAKLARIPSLTLYDYEGASVGLFNRLSTWVMTPEVVASVLLKSKALPTKKLLSYPGLKEEVYLSQFIPDASVYSELSLDASKILVTVRPPSETAHYRSDESQRLFTGILELLKPRADIQIVISARTTSQRTRLKLALAGWENVRIPEKAFDGLNLLYHSDLLIGGGGTMNREAAVLGVPVLSIFKGVEGAVDAQLIHSGKMTEISKVGGISPFLKKRQKTASPLSSSATLDKIVETIEKLARGSKMTR